MGKIVVFGGNGFIGRHLVRRLALTDSSNDIYVFDKFGSYQIGMEHPFDQHDNVSIVPGNFFNRDEVGDVIEGASYVFHLISTTNPAASNNDPFIDIDTNIRSSVELFQQCAELGVKKVIFFSSGGTVYGDIDGDRISEASVTRPLSPYGIGKLTIENYLRYFKHTHDLDYIIYRIANPYGPGQNIYGKQGVIPIFMHRYLVKEPLTIYGDGSMMRDYIYIDDLIDMITGSYASNNRHEVYNLGNGKGVSVSNLVEAIERCAGYEAEKRHLETPSTYIQSSVLDIQRFVDEFAIKPSTTLGEGIERTWNHVKELE